MGDESHRDAVAADERSRSSRPLMAAALAVILLAGGLRLYHLDHESLWLDELVQVDCYSRSLKGVVLGAAAQTQTPLDYLLGWGLHQVGLAGSDWWVRLPACLFAMASICVLMWWTRRLFGDVAALIAGLFVAFSPLHVLMSQEARPYTIFLFLALLTSMLYARARVKNRSGAWAAFGCVFFLMLLARWVGPLVIALHLGAYATAALAISLWRSSADEKREETRRFAATAAALAVSSVLYLPCFLLVYRCSAPYIRSGGSSAGQAVARGAGMLVGTFSAGFPADMALFRWSAYCLALVGLVLALRARRAGPGDQPRDAEPTADRRTGRRVFFLVFGTFALSYSAIYAVKGGAPPKPQYLLPMIPFVAACVGWALGALSALRSQRSIGRAAAVGVTIAVAIPMAADAWRTVTVRTKRDWRTACRVAVERGDAGGALFVGVAPTRASWAGFLGVQRYTGRDRPGYSVRQLADAIGREELPSGTLYVAFCRYYRGRRPEVPEPAHMPQGMTRHNAAEIVLYRLPGAATSSMDRLLVALEFLSTACKPGDGYVELYHATCRLHGTMGRSDRARRAYARALAQCRNAAERRRFLRQTTSTRVRFGIPDNTPAAP